MQIEGLKDYKLETMKLNFADDTTIFLRDSKAWLFETLIFELEASYSFRITCILVRQAYTLGHIKKNW